MAVLNHSMQRAHFACGQTLRTHRWLAVILLITIVLFGLVAHAWWRGHTLQHALQQLPAPTKRALPVTQSRPQVVSVLQTWPSEDEADRISAEILATADAMGMLFERAEFQSVAVEHSGLQVQRIKLPLKGDYLQVRHFLQQVLQHYPSLALSQFKLQRSDVLQPELEAYVEFSLYTRKRGQA
jgi:hypothetical protein